MLDRAEEHVGVGEPPRLLPGQVAALGEPVEGAQAVRLAEPWILRSVEELERLDVELDVADPAHAQLDVALLLAAGPEEAVDPALHRADLADGLALQAGSIGDLARELEEGLSDALVPGRHPRLDQRLALPEGPARRVIGAVRGERQGGGPPVPSGRSRRSTR